MDIDNLLSIQPRDLLNESDQVEKAKEILNSIRKDLKIKNKETRERPINRDKVFSIMLDSKNTGKPFIDAFRIHIDNALGEIYRVGINPTLDDQLGEGITKKTLKKYFPKAKLGTRARALGDFDLYDVV